MRIVHVVNTDFFGRFLMLDQLRALKDAGHDVRLVTGPGPLVPEIEAEGLPVTVLRSSREMNPLADLGTLSRLARHFREIGADLVHTHNPKLNLLGPLAARIAGVRRIVATVHGYYFHADMPGPQRAFYKSLERLSAAAADLVFTQSREDYETALREGLCAPHKLEHLGNGIDLTRFDPARFGPGDVLRVKDRLGIPPGAPVVGMVGRMVREKGYPEFIEAAARIALKRPDAHFLLIGPDERWQKRDALTRESVMEEAARVPALRGKLRVLGLRRDLPSLYAAIDVVALPSHREGFPRSLIEAAAMARPVVATDIRGCREVVRNGQTGFLVPVKDPASLADKILTLIEAPDLAGEMGRRARAAALAHDEREVCRKILAGYARLAAADQSLISAI
ncbi:MAG: glycosyltransferase family 4 protein [Deltaproteobacteria bacterium]|nr:glycosyltransferase family 4 protein [Deltaproteobacteria bacterium]